MISLFILVALAFLLDYIFAEPKRFHPLVGFGAWASLLERYCRSAENNKSNRWRGVLAWMFTVLPVLFAFSWLHYILCESLFADAFSVLVLYLALGWQSLLNHAKAISSALHAGDMPTARHAISMIVSRDTKELNETEIAKAATESVLENGADAIFAAIFWFCILGVPGVVLYRLSNTLDAMWGYKNTRFYHFGWAAARIDDVLNYIPARLTASSYALMGNTAEALRCWRKQGYGWKSPNAGPVMATGAGSLGVSLGGAASYHGETQMRPLLGLPESDATRANAHSIDQACRLINRSIILWLGILWLLWGLQWLM